MASKHKDQIADIKGLDWLEQDHIPEAPTDLTEEAKWLWNYQLTQSANVDGYISHIDLALFKEYCYVYGELEWPLLRKGLFYASNCPIPSQKVYIL